MTNELSLLLGAVCALFLAVIFVWLLLKGRSGSQEAALALQQQKALLDQHSAALVALAQQVTGLAAATPAELDRLRESVSGQLALQRQDLSGQLGLAQQANAAQTATIGQSLATAFEQFSAALAGQGTQGSERAEALRKTLADQLTALNTSVMADARAARDEAAQQLKNFREELSAQMARMSEANRQSGQDLRQAVELRLKELQTDNAQKLEAMRHTVDEKLQSTLEARLGESFKQVSERLEQVHRGLGEMQSIAVGVGDLKRVLTNVKTRGGWGEIQLGNLLEQLLTTEQFAAQVAVRPGSGERVDFGIKLPGKGAANEAPVWIPIDAKFPVEDYQRLMDAHERADLAAIDVAAMALEGAVRKQAKSIGEKYIHPPHTTDFGLLYLPTEGLYAEVLRRPGLADDLQREYRVIVTGPTTISALLNSLQMGFRSLAIEKRSSDVWQMLGAVKTEFGKFGEVLDKVGEKLDLAQKQLQQTGVRSRAIHRQLRQIEAMPVEQSKAMLALGEVDDDGKSSP